MTSKWYCSSFCFQTAREGLCVQSGYGSVSHVTFRVVVGSRSLWFPACFCHSACWLFWACCSLDFVLMGAAFCVDGVAALPRCHRCGLALVGPGPRLLPLACRALRFQLFVVDREFVTVRGFVSILLQDDTKICVVTVATLKGLWAGFMLAKCSQFSGVLDMLSDACDQGHFVD